MSHLEERIDPQGCFWFVLQFVGCGVFAYVLLFAALLAIGIISWLLA